MELHFSSKAQSSECSELKKLLLINFFDLLIGF